MNYYFFNCIKQFFHTGDTHVAEGDQSLCVLKYYFSLRCVETIVHNTILKWPWTKNIESVGAIITRSTRWIFWDIKSSTYGISLHEERILVRSFKIEGNTAALEIHRFRWMGLNALVVLFFGHPSDIHAERCEGVITMSSCWLVVIHSKLFRDSHSNCKWTITKEDVLQFKCVYKLNIPSN